MYVLKMKKHEKHAFVTPVVEHWLEREIAQWVLFNETRQYNIHIFDKDIFFEHRTRQVIYLLVCVALLVLSYTYKRYIYWKYVYCIVLSY